MDAPLPTKRAKRTEVCRRIILTGGWVVMRSKEKKVKLLRRGPQNDSDTLVVLTVTSVAV